MREHRCCVSVGFVAVVMLGACGEVKRFTDAGTGDDVSVDAAACSSEVACSQTSDDCCPDACGAGEDVDCVAVCDDSVACASSDGCCPGDGLGACNANNDSDCAPVCGNGAVEAGENCEGSDCACPAEAYTCFASVGGADTCNIECHVPVQACGPADGCCPFVSGSDGASCSADSDAECAGAGWRALAWGEVDYREICRVERIYGIEAGTSYLFTTCAAPGEVTGTGNPEIMSVIDNTGRSYAVGNDDCTEPSAIPRIQQWDCRSSTHGADRMSCASPSDGGFIVTDPEVYRLDVTICPSGGPEASGTSPFHIWWNGPNSPNAG